MPTSRDLVGLLVAGEFVLSVALLLLVAPLEAALPLLPLALVFSVALYRYVT